MLDQFLANPPTITERLAFPQSPKTIAKVFGNRKREAKQYLGEWQASWERRE
jgi:hypothetical protein